ncbi:MAG: hypothetical protein M1818_005619 [Claussenomyces sp. TS43310]|nr:MAG: hypothetical protein M1818_005619 [Claussenomyces sp. TS43310]
MVFEKYKARKAISKELKAQSAELERVHYQLSQRRPPAYDTIYSDQNPGTTKTAEMIHSTSAIPVSSHARAPVAI